VGSRTFGVTSVIPASPGAKDETMKESASLALTPTSDLNPAARR
jgi:hypothetical protein